MLLAQMLGLALAGLVAVDRPVSGPATYSVIDLGILPGGSFSKAHAISDSGFVAGASTANGEATYANSFLWIDGAMLDLGGLGVSGSVARGVNDTGTVVGITDELSLNAYRWSKGVLTPLPTLDGLFSSAAAIDNIGRIVGVAHLSSGEPRAVLWQESVAMPLGTLGGFGSEGTAINSAGIIVGEAGTATGHSHAFLWDGAVMHDLGAPAGSQSFATAVNTSNDVVGYSLDFEILGLSRALLWRGGDIIDLGSLGGQYSYANSINDDAVIVGSSYLPDLAHPTQHAFIWERGVIRDLNDFISAESNWVLAEAMDINNNGLIVGNGLHNGQLRAFLLTPAAIPPADLNRDGFVDGVDLASLLASWGSCAPAPAACSADLDQSGSVDGVDLAQLLAAWHPHAPSG